MSKQVKMVEVTHQWQGKGILRGDDGVLKEVELGTVSTEKKLKETGVKELFKEGNVPAGLIAIEVIKLDDVKITYVADSDEFKKIAKIEETQEGDFTTEQVFDPNC